LGFADTPQTGTTLTDNGRTISYLPGDAGYRCFISKRAFDKGKHYIEVPIHLLSLSSSPSSSSSPHTPQVHFKTLKEGFDKGVRDSNTYGFGLANRTIYTINGGSSYLSSNNVRPAHKAITSTTSTQHPPPSTHHPAPPPDDDDDAGKGLVRQWQCVQHRR
jgi:hypothetical protein